MHQAFNLRAPRHSGVLPPARLHHLNLSKQRMGPQVGTKCSDWAKSCLHKISLHKVEKTHRQAVVNDLPLSRVVFILAMEMKVCLV